METNWINIIGLALDIVGVWLIYWYAIPNLGADVLGWGDKRKQDREKKLGHAGLGLITLGFSLQAVASGLALAQS